MSERFLSTTKAGERLGLGRHEMRRLCELGRIDGARQLTRGGHWRIPVETIEGMLAATRPRRRGGNR